MKAVQSMLVASIFGITAALSTPVAEAQLTSVSVSGELQTRGNGKAVGSFEGTLEINEFTVDADGVLSAVGTITGEVLNRGGRVLRRVNEEVVIPVTELIASEDVCEVLSLSLGAIDLNVLGLIVHLDPVLLDISADPAGGLLGELLCSLAGDLGGTVSDLLNLPIDELVELVDVDSVLDILNDIGG